MQTTKLSLLVLILVLITACGKKSSDHIKGLATKSTGGGAVVDQPAQVIIETPSQIGSGTPEILESNNGAIPVEVQITNEGVVVVRTTPEAGQIVADTLATVPNVEVLDESPVLPTPVPPALVESSVVEEPVVTIGPVTPAQPVVEAPAVYEPIVTQEPVVVNESTPTVAPSAPVTEVPAVYETITVRDPVVVNNQNSNTETTGSATAQTPAPVVENDNNSIDDVNEDNIQESDFEKYKNKSKLLKLFCDKIRHRIQVLEKNLENWLKNKNNKNDVAVAKALEELKLLKGILEKAERLLK